MWFINFIKRQWLALVIIIAWILFSIYTRPDVKKLNEDVKKNEIKVDSIEKENSNIDEQIKTIKEIEYVEVKNVDTMSVSELQSYFTDRYGK